MSRIERPCMLHEDFQYRVDGIAGVTGEGR